MYRDVDDWLVGFLSRHRGRYRPFDWPEPDTEEEVLFWEVWSRAFRDRGITEGEADIASIGLGVDPPRYRSQHLPAILKAVAAARTARGNAASYRPAAVAPVPPIAYPDGVPEGDIKALWRHLVRSGGGNPDRGTSPRLGGGRPDGDAG